MKKLLLLLCICTVVACGIPSNVYNNAGLVKFNKKDYNGAIQEFGIAIKVNPQDTLAYL